MQFCGKQEEMWGQGEEGVGMEEGIRLFWKDFRIWSSWWNLIMEYLELQWKVGAATYLGFESDNLDGIGCFGLGNRLMIF